MHYTPRSSLVYYAAASNEFAISSFYCGVGGALQRTACAPGGRCLSRPDGYDDVCLPSPGTGEACGANSWVSVFTCNRDRTQRVLCAQGVLLRESCPRGCLTRPSGEDDVCAP